MLFLVAWEVMSLASFFLVTYEHEREDVRRAGWTYLVAMHLGTAFLLALFVLLDRTGTMEFSGFGATGAAGGRGLPVSTSRGVGELRSSDRCGREW